MCVCECKYLSMCVCGVERGNGPRAPTCSEVYTCMCVHICEQLVYVCGM